MLRVPSPILLLSLVALSCLTCWKPSSCWAYLNIRRSIRSPPLLPLPRGGTRLQQAKTKDSAMTATRVPLTRIFNGEREYLFTTRKNVRSFEWTQSEVEDLFESIMELDKDNDELELNSITIMPTAATAAAEEEKQKIGRTAQIYDVHDGQQRLVSLSLLLAALRDNLLKWEEEEHESDDDEDNNDNNNDLYQDDILEVSKAIFPAKSRLKAVNRIQLRDTQGHWLNMILSPSANTNTNTNASTTTTTTSSVYENLPKKRQRKDLPQSDRLIIEAYEYLYQRIGELGPSQALEVLLENFMTKVFLLVCIPANTRIARNMVMGLGKGKNLEPVDEFKGMVCFNSIKAEARQDEILEGWNQLCDQVGRETVQTACIQFAQIYLRKPLQRNGELDLMEDFLNKYMEEKPGDGGVIFQEKLVPISLTLQYFRDGSIAMASTSTSKSTSATKKDDADGDYIGHEDNKDEDDSAQHENKDWPSLRFLWSVSSTVASAKEIELVALFLLIHWHATDDVVEKTEIQRKLRQLEGVAVLMMLTKPKRTERLQRCFAIMDYCSSTKTKQHDDENNDAMSPSSSSSPLELTLEERRTIYDILDEDEFGGKLAGSKIAKLVLERLNEFELIVGSSPNQDIIAGKLQLEHILPKQKDSYHEYSIDWDTNTAEHWMNRLGNLALLNQKPTAAISSGPFAQKKNLLFDNSPYPLTRLVSSYNGWSIQAVQQHHDTTLRLASQVWNLDHV